MTPLARFQRRLSLGASMGEAIVGCALIRHGLRRSSLPELCSRLGIIFGTDRAEPRPPSSDHQDPAVRTAVRVALRVSTALWRKPSCLQQSLLVGFLLRARRPVLRIGWWKSPLSQNGHAWVEIAGEPVVGLPGVAKDWTDKIAVLGKQSS